MPSFVEFSKLDREGSVQGGKPFLDTHSQDTSRGGVARPARPPERPGGVNEVLRFVSFPFQQGGGYFGLCGVFQHCSGQYVYKEKAEEGCARAGRLEGKDFWMAGKPLASPSPPPPGSPPPSPCSDFLRVASLFRFGI